MLEIPPFKIKKVYLVKQRIRDSLYYKMIHSAIWSKQVIIGICIYTYKTSKNHQRTLSIRPLHVSLEGFSFSTQVHYNSCCKTSSEIALTSITLKLWTQTKLNVKPKINLKNWKPHKNRCLFVWFGFFIFQTTRFGSRTRKWNQTKSYCKSP